MCIYILYRVNFHEVILKKVLLAEFLKQFLE